MTSQWNTKSKIATSKYCGKYSWNVLCGGGHLVCKKIDNVLFHFFVIFKLDLNFEIKVSMFYSESVWFAMHRRLEFGENNETRMTVLIIYAENK